jgi:hypothetical protein
MMGNNGIYLVYRRYAERNEQRLVGRFAILGGRIMHLDDHDGVIASAFPKGPLTARTLHRLEYMERSPYWRIVHEDHLDEHPDLIPDLPVGATPWVQPQE